MNVRQATFAFELLEIVNGVFLSQAEHRKNYYESRAANSIIISKRARRCLRSEIACNMDGISTDLKVCFAKP